MKRKILSELKKVIISNNGNKLEINFDAIRNNSSLTFENLFNFSEEKKLLSVQKLGLSPRAVNALNKGDIKTIANLIQLNINTLYRWKGIGKDTYLEIFTALALSSTEKYSGIEIIKHYESPNEKEYLGVTILNNTMQLIYQNTLECSKLTFKDLFDIPAESQDIPIKDLDIAKAAKASLQDLAKVNTINDLLSKKVASVFRMRNFGKIKFLKLLNELAKLNNGEFDSVEYK